MASPGYIAPPVPGQPVPKEYVRQQLVRLGIRNVTEEELEFYAAGEDIYVPIHTVLANFTVE